MNIENSMRADQKVKLKSLLIKHEGDRDYPHYDIEGCITIGIGRNLSFRGIYQDEKELMLKNDVDFIYDHLSKNYAWFQELNESRQIAFIDMAFMGIKNFESFKKMLKAMDNHDYSRAYAEILESSYARKFNIRANEIAKIILYGVIQ